MPRHLLNEKKDARPKQTSQGTEPVKIQDLQNQINLLTNSIEELKKK